MRKIWSSFVAKFNVKLHRKSLWLFSHNFKITIVLLVFAISIAYLGYPEFTKPNIYDGLPKIVGASLNAFVDPGEKIKNVWLYVSQVVAFVAFSIVILSGLFRDSLSNKLHKSIAIGRHSIVVGLGENNRYFLDSEYKKKSYGQYIIIEADKNNSHIEAYREKGFGIFFGTIEDYTINFNTLENVLISAGDDRLNIDIAGQIKSQLDTANLGEVDFGCNTSVFLHLSDHSYKTIFHEGLLTPENSKLPLEYRTYSYEDSAARSLFMEDTVLGDYVEDLIDTNKEFSVVVVGSGILAERVIYHLVMMASLPEQNKLNLYLYCENSSQFMDRLRAAFFDFDSKMSNVELHGRDVIFNTSELYEQTLWIKKLQNLTQVYICHDEESLNLKTAINLHEHVYLKYLQEEFSKTKKIPKVKTKFHFAMYHNLALAEVINADKSEFNQFYVFGDAKKIFNREFLIDAPHETVAKLINSGYSEELADDNEKLDEQTKLVAQKKADEKWLETSRFGDRESNRAQALHMHTKLVALGVNVNYKDKDKEYSFPNSEKDGYRDYVLSKSKNRPSNGSRFEGDILDVVKVLGLQVSHSYGGCGVNPETIEWIFDRLVDRSSLLSKLIISEHERWNRFHILNGWMPIEETIEKNKPLKLHRCLKPLNEFRDPELRMTVLYDLYSVLYINMYLNYLGFKKVAQPKENFEQPEDHPESIIIGVTGKRDLKKKDEQIKEQITFQLTRLFKEPKYQKIKELTLVSPLAEGADRLLVDVVVDYLKSDLNKNKITLKKFKLLIPFEKNEYKAKFGNCNGKLKDGQ